MSLLSEIKRRKVVQVAAAYAVVAWLLVQIVVAVEEPLDLPAWFDTVTIVLLAIGFPIAVILAWAYDVTPGGVKRMEPVEPNATYRDRSHGDAVPVSPQAWTASRFRPSPSGIALGILIAGSVAIGWAWQRTGAASRARTETIPAIAALVEAGDYTAAFARAQEVPDRFHADPLLASLTPQFTATYTVSTSPPDAMIYVRGYGAAGETWQALGPTPLTNVRLPRRALRWRIEKPGFLTAEYATTAQDDTFGQGHIELTLGAAGEQPPDMVSVSAGASGTAPNGLPLPQVTLVAFLIDRTEVTNRAFEEFVAADGYERRSYWEGLDFVTENGEALSWEEAMARFVDSTGRPGPATWELGDFPPGQGEYPVAGISWYEAMAYARYRERSLPTVFHWTHAALPVVDVGSSLAASITPLSNFGSSGPAPVASYQGMGPRGTYDMFGNVREWVLNQGERGGWLLGSSWEDPAYSYFGAVAAPLIERSPLNGFRLMRETAPSATALREPIDLQARPRDPDATPVPDEVFAVLMSEFAYRSGELDATEPVAMETTEDWVKQRVTIDAGYSGERLDVVLFIPARSRPPYQPVVFLGGLDVVLEPKSLDAIQLGFGAMPLDFIVRSGRAFVVPAYQGTFNRFKAPMNPIDRLRTTREWIDRRWDLGRTIDYLETRSDMDTSKVGYVGVSFGASYGLPLVATEPRLSVAVLLSGGMPPQGLGSEISLIDPLNHAPRIKIPVLMINGRYDYVFPLESQQRLFDLLGTPAGEKRYVVLPSGHGSPPRADLLRETLGWLDRYLGQPVE